jgi:hypothetical protein
METKTSLNHETPPAAKPLLGDVSSCKHLYSYYWKRGKCKGSKCSLCGNLDRTLKPNVG